MKDEDGKTDLDKAIEAFDRLKPCDFEIFFKTVFRLMMRKLYWLTQF